jgi:septal ring factor EnvC (AmiA/AmiB activator)
MRLVRRLVLPLLFATFILHFVTSSAVAQDEPKPDQLKKMYDDAIAQLKNAQDRRNDLAAENEKLAARVKELEGKLSATQGQFDAIKKDAAVYAEKTFYLRSHYAAWQGFLQIYPEILSRWKLYLGTGMVVPKPVEGGANDAWPFDVSG